VKVSQIDKTNFCAGSLFLKDINKNQFQCFDAIKKIAEDKNVDVFISKKENSYFLPTDNLYTVIANKLGGCHGVACAIVNKKTCAEGVSVKIFNAAMNAIDHLESKLTK